MEPKHPRAAQAAQGGPGHTFSPTELASLTDAMIGARLSLSDIETMVKKSRGSGHTWDLGGV